MYSFLSIVLNMPLQHFWLVCILPPKNHFRVMHLVAMPLSSPLIWNSLSVSLSIFPAFLTFLSRFIFIFYFFIFFPLMSFILSICVCVCVDRFFIISLFLLYKFYVYILYGYLRASIRWLEVITVGFKLISTYGHFHKITVYQSPSHFMLLS